MTTRRGNTSLFCSSQQLPRVSLLGPLKGFSELIHVPSKGPRLTSHVASGTAENDERMTLSGVPRYAQRGPRTPP